MQIRWSLILVYRSFHDVRYIMNPTQEQEHERQARPFVIVEPILALEVSLGIICVAAVVSHFFTAPWWALVIISLLAGLTGMMFWLIMIGYRILNYLLHFVGMADLLNATRIAITSVFAPTRR